VSARTPSSPRSSRRRPRPSKWPGRGKTAAGRAAAKLFDDEFLKKLEYLYLVSKKLFAGHIRAERRTKKVGSGIEFADHRDYTLGDDFRYIDWNIYGRMDKLLLRLFEEEEDLSIYMLLDARCRCASASRRPSCTTR
jgi:uncharacterized protein (DUF58 family)